MRRFYGPPHAWRGPHGWREWHGDDPEWKSKRRYLFRRFIRFAAGALLIFLAGMGGLAFLFTRLFDGSGQVTLLTWLVGLGLSLGLPLLAGFTAVRWFTGLANPLARIMAAADAVAEGNFKVRVPEAGPGEFGRLARSFNRMAAELERTDRLRRELTADVAHELRTPLHILQGNLEGLLDGVYTATPDHIELLLDETRQLSRLVEDLRTLSLAEAGQLSLHSEAIDVNEMLDDLATSFSGQAAAASIRLGVEGANREEAPLMLWADAGRLDQVLSNLAANALQHTPAGGEVTLRAAPSETGVCIQISDSGRGISAEDLPYVFDRFWRGEPALKGAAAGSGLGLAIARQIVQAHGGKISVESQPGQGTTFTLDFPRPAEDGAPSPQG